jgi:hypothetical protein
MMKLRWGVIGAGGIADRRTIPEGIVPARNARLVAVMDVDKKRTDEVNPQWKQVLDDLRIKLIYALSPQAKGKIERPYGWLQDRIVRTCAREGVDNVIDGNRVLEAEADRYNYKQVHSTTGEVPYYRLKRLASEGKSLVYKRYICSKRSENCKSIQKNII